MAKKKVHLTDTLPPREELLTIRNKPKFEVYGEEMIEKEVKQSGNSGEFTFPRSGWGSM